MVVAARARRLVAAAARSGRICAEVPSVQAQAWRLVVVEAAAQHVPGRCGRPRAQEADRDEKVRKSFDELLDELVMRKQ